MRRGSPVVGLCRRRKARLCIWSSAELVLTLHVL